MTPHIVFALIASGLGLIVVLALIASILTIREEQENEKDKH